MSLWYDSRPLKIGWFAMLAAVGAEVCFNESSGTPMVWTRRRVRKRLDGLWRFNVISNIIFSAATRVDLANAGSQRRQRRPQTD
jgi:hypothetical protein